MHARYYSPNLGRFLSSDPKPWRRSTMKLQTWNKYAYVRENPIKYIDPEGLAECASVSGFEDIQIDDCITVTESAPGAFESIFNDFLTRVRNQTPSAIDFVRDALRRTPANNSVPNDVMFVDGEFRRAGPTAEQIVVTAVGVAAVVSINQAKQQVRRGQAPRTVERVDPARGDFGQDEVHFKDGSALKRDGTWKHRGKSLTNKEKAMARDHWLRHAS